MHRVVEGFPDFHADPGDVFVDGNEGMMTVRFAGTHENEFMNIPPTGREIELNGMSKVHVADGRIRELHDVVNMQSLLTQLGVAEG
jgi:predicted ester cyclase